jgi:hypothetical protein
MKCSQCGGQNVLVEGIGDGKSRVTCQSCRHTEVIDSQGRRMLTDEMPHVDRRRVLTEAR